MELNYIETTRMEHVYTNEETNCCDCNKNLQLILDGEATTEQEEFFKDHLNDCMPCFKSYESEKAIKDLIKLKIAHKSVPQGLIENIRSKISQTV